MRYVIRWSIFVWLMSFALAIPIHDLERAEPHHPTIPAHRPQSPDHNATIFYRPIISIIQTQKYPDYSLLRELLQDLQRSWHAQMQLKAWWERGAASRGLDDRDVSDDMDKEKRTVEEERWKIDCRWLLEVAGHITTAYSLAANPLAVFPDTDLDICT